MDQSRPRKNEDPWTEVPLVHLRTTLFIVRAFGSAHFDMVFDIVLRMVLGTRTGGFAGRSEDGFAWLEGWFEGWFGGWF